MHDLARLARRPVSGDKVPEHLGDAIGFGATVGGWDGEDIRELSAEQVAMAALATRASPILAGNKGGHPRDDVTLAYARELSRIYKDVSGQPKLTRSRNNRYGKRGQPNGPCFRFIKSCLQPLRPDLSDERIVELMEHAL